jgi:hypothetical protein
VAQDYHDNLKNLHPIPNYPKTRYFLIPTEKQLVAGESVERLVARCHPLE